MDFSSHNPLTSNSLNIAARNNDVTNVRKYLKKINPNCVDNRGWTCLHEAANSDSFESLEIILKHPLCRPLAVTHEGHTALYVACRNTCSLRTIKLLLDNVLNIANFSSTEGVTPLHIVSGQGRIDVIQMLIDYGAIPDSQDFDGDTPLHEACLGKHDEAVKLLLRAGANPRIHNHQLFTPLHIACSSGSLTSVENLLKFPLNINQTISSGDTPLMVALHGQNIFLINFLLKNGADPNLTNYDEKLALDIALDIGFSSAFKALLPVTDEDCINSNIVVRACKPHYFKCDILYELLTSNYLGPRFFEYEETFPPITVENICEFTPTYDTHVPINSYLNICEYMYRMANDMFWEYFDLFLKRNTAVNATKTNELPPLVYIHYCSHKSSFEDVLEKLIKHGCNVDYCSDVDKEQSIPDAFLASISLDPCTTPVMIPYSLVCDPGYILKFAFENGVLNRMSINVQTTLLSMITNESHTHSEITSLIYSVKSLKHLSRLKVREIIRNKDGRPKTTQEYLNIIKTLPVPPMIQNYLRFL